MLEAIKAWLEASGRTRRSTESSGAGSGAGGDAIFVTGGAGFIGLAVVRRLVERGDRVMAVVRDPDRAAALTDLGVATRAGDLSRTAAIVDAMRGTDAAIHIAGMYRVGIPRPSAPRHARRQCRGDAPHHRRRRRPPASTGWSTSRPSMSWATPRAASSTRRHRRDLADGFLSYYDETKYLAHELSRSGSTRACRRSSSCRASSTDRATTRHRRAAARRATTGRSVTSALADLGISAVHVDDLAAGIVAALDRGRIGESYVLAGENMRLRDAMRVAARLGGREPPRLDIPTALLRIGADRRRLGARCPACPPNLREIVRAADGVTYWASPAKAAAELGFGHVTSQGSRTSDAFGRADRSGGRSVTYTPRHGPRAPDVQPRPAARGAHRAESDDRDGRRLAGGPPPTARSRCAAIPTGSRPAMPSGDNYHELKGLLRGLALNTVCEEAHCPNIGECWDQRTATIMILGDTCTRACGFCAVKTGRPTWFDDDEPRRVAEAIAALGLEHVVVTSVARDDLPDGGARIFAETIRALRETSPGMGIEVLIPDFNGADAPLRAVMDARPDILNHNLETVRRLQKPVRKRARWDRSLDVLERAKAMAARDRLPGPHQELADGRPRRDARRADRGVRGAARRRLRHPDDRPVPAAVAPAPAARALLPPRRVRRDEGRGARARLQARRVGPLVRSSYHARDQVPGAELKRLRRQATIDAEGRVVPLAG